jgi:hypothetical protein
MWVVEAAWQDLGEQVSLGRVTDHLGDLGRSLAEWDHTTFGSVRKNLAHLRKELERVRGQSLGTGPSSEERRLMKQISEMLSREEVMEKQRSRVDWLKEGDRNTAFFQAKSRERAKCNHITSLLKPDGERVTEQAEIESVARQFYSELFTVQEILEPGPVLNYVPQRLTDQMNAELTKPFEAEEVRTALFKMGLNQAPGPNGFTAGFFPAPLATVWTEYHQSGPGFSQWR